MGEIEKLLYRVGSGNEGPTPDWLRGGCSYEKDGAEDRTIIQEFRNGERTSTIFGCVGLKVC
jgi:hypothetical protein